MYVCVRDVGDTRVALKLIRGSLFVKYVDIIRFNDPCWLSPSLSLSLFLFFPFFLSWSRGSCRVTGCCHGGCLSSSLTSATLYHHAHIHLWRREERRKTTTLYINATNRWLEDTTASKMILTYPCVHACRARINTSGSQVCMRSKIYIYATTAQRRRNYRF